MAIAPSPTDKMADTASPPDYSPQANNFNFMRLCLAVLVILSHSFEIIDGNRHREPLTRIFHTLSFGEVAVDAFFLLSGYLIVKSWDQRPLLLSYVKKRVYRIYPGFIAASLICAFVVGPLASNASLYFSHFNLKHFVGSVVLLDAPAIPSVFSGLHYPVVNGSMWTIYYEFRCYVAVALIGLTGMVKKKWPWLLITILALAASLLPTPSINRIAFHARMFIIGSPDEFFRLFALFCAGGVFYLYRDKINYRPSLMLVALLATVAGMFNVHTAQFVLATCGAYVFFGIGFKHIQGLEWHRSWPDISYGVYLYGWPCTILIFWYYRSIDPYLLFPCALLLTSCLGWLSWRWVESPFMKRKPI